MRQQRGIKAAANNSLAQSNNSSTGGESLRSMKRQPMLIRDCANETDD
jgi:hypothetical protein